jgi:hypothetical protein
MWPCSGFTGCVVMLRMRLDEAELLADAFDLLGEDFIKTRLIEDDDLGGALRRNRVPGTAAAHGGQSDDFLTAGTEDAGHELDGIRAAFVDLQAGMPAAQAGDVDGEKGLFGVVRGLRVVEARQRIHAARAADGEGVVLFGVEIEHRFAREQAGLQTERAAHALLFIQREECLDGRMRQVFGRQHREDRGDAEAVVRAERGAACAHPVAIDPHVDALLCRSRSSGHLPPCEPCRDAPA